MPLYRWFGAALIFCFLSVFSAHGHVPVPDSVLDPKTPEEAWNVLRLTTDNVARLLKENRLSEVADQISLCAPALRFLSKTGVSSPDLKRQASVQAVQSSVAITSLAQASLAGDKATSEAMFADLRRHLISLAQAYDLRVTKAEIYSCPMHPDAVSADIGARCEKCGMGLLPRRIPYSFVYVPAGEPSIQMFIVNAKRLQSGQRCSITVHLNRYDGTPVVLSDLLVMHTQPIHLLIVDPGLADYHHEHPQSTGVPGEYNFSFTPRSESDYRVFADIVPATTGVQEYPWVDLLGAREAVASKSVVQGPDILAAQSNGLNFQLKVGEGQPGIVRAGQVCGLSITVSDATSGKAVNSLEPVMNAFAHLVGFYGDCRTVVHLHPLGAEVTDPKIHGGPTLEFRFYPPKSGFVRLYCQVQVGGRAIYCPFSLNVLP